MKKIILILSKICYFYVRFNEKFYTGFVWKLQTVFSDIWDSNKIFSSISNERGKEEDKSSFFSNKIIFSYINWSPL